MDVRGARGRAGPRASDACFDPASSRDGQGAISTTAVPRREHPRPQGVPTTLDVRRSQNHRRRGRTFPIGGSKVVAGRRGTSEPRRRTQGLQSPVDGPTEESSGGNTTSPTTDFPGVETSDGVTVLNADGGKKKGTWSAPSTLGEHRPGKAVPGAVGLTREGLPVVAPEGARLRLLQPFNQAHGRHIIDQGSRKSKDGGRNLEPGRRRGGRIFPTPRVLQISTIGTPMSAPDSGFGGSGVHK